jgi:hypothetical protein
MTRVVDEDRHKTHRQPDLHGGMRKPEERVRAKNERSDLDEKALTCDDLHRPS